MKNDFVEAVTGEEPFQSFEGPYGERSKSFDVKPMMDKENPYNKDIKQYKYTVDEGTFVVFRLWEECPRCIDAYKAGNLVFPIDDSDYVCPHTKLADYKKLVQKFMSEGWVPTSTKKDVLKNGTVIISMGWAIPEVKAGPARRAPQRL